MLVGYIDGYCNVEKDLLIRDCSDVVVRGDVELMEIMGLLTQDDSIIVRNTNTSKLVKELSKVGIMTQCLSDNDLISGGIVDVSVYRGVFVKYLDALRDGKDVSLKGVCDRYNVNYNRVYRYINNYIKVHNKELYNRYLGTKGIKKGC